MGKSKRETENEKRLRLQLAFAGWLPDLESDDVDSDDWYTPPELVAEIEDYLGGIDLDPCWSPRSFVKPKIGYTEKDNGLARKWQGTVPDARGEDVEIRTRFVNPPYSHPGPWMRELADLHTLPGAIAGTSLALVRIDTSTWWWQLAWEADAICFFRARIPFVRPGSTLRSQPRDHHALIMWGGDYEAFRYHWEWLGHCQPGTCTPQLDAPIAREHERSGEHRLITIDKIPAQTYPLLPTGRVLEDLYVQPDVDPNAITAVLEVDHGRYCRFCATRLVLRPRDESKPPPGFTESDPDDPGVVLRPAFKGSTRKAWALYHTEHAPAEASRSEPTDQGDGPLWCPDVDCDSIDGRTIPTRDRGQS